MSAELHDPDEGSASDRLLAQVLRTQWPDGDPLLQPWIERLQRHVRQGHTCITLDDAGDGVLESLRRWSAVACGAAEDHQPLVLDAGGRLYLRRYWQYEQHVADALRTRARGDPVMGRDVDLDAILRPLLPDHARVDPQYAAIRHVLNHRLCVLLGGPGTGKTWTVVRMMVALQALHAHAPLRIALVAPTGKAAARMEEAVAQALARLPTPAAAHVPRQASTVHQLLGASKDLRHCRFHANAPLPLDALMVDECSMLDLPLMAHLVAALPAHARLVLVGDPDQLASVETGSVLSELRTLAMRAQGRSLPADAVASHVFALRTPHRFGSEEVLSQALECIRTGDAAGLWDMLLAERPALRWIDPGPTSPVSVLAPLPGVCAVFNHESEALSALGQMRVLTALREGSWGALGIADGLREAFAGGDLMGDCYAPGEPVMVLRNAPRLGLINGDVGVAWSSPTGWGVWFEKSLGERLWVDAAELPAHQSARAMTVHKAQGSEFDRVAVVMAKQPHPLLTREWLYTAVSRARSGVTLIGAREAIQCALVQRIQRTAGLADALDTT